MSKNNHTYVLTSWVQAMLAGLKMEGCDETTIVATSGIDPSLLEKGYCSLELFIRLFDAAEKHYGQYVGVASSQGATPSSFRSLSIALIASDSLYDCFQLLAKHNCLITNTMTFIVDDKDGGRFGFSLREDLSISPSLTSAVLGRALTTARFIHPGSNLINKVSLAYPKPDNFEVYENYFEAPVQWSGDINAVHFEQSAFRCPSTQANKAVRESAEKQWLDEVAHYNDLSFIESAQAVIKANLSDSRITIETLAEKFGMSVRTLQRRLDQEQTSFSKLVEEVKKQQAKTLLKQNAENITDVAFQLGFSNSGSFSRAFKRWFDVSPDQYRKTLLSE